MLPSKNYKGCTLVQVSSPGVLRRAQGSSAVAFIGALGAQFPFEFHVFGHVSLISLLCSRFASSFLYLVLTK